MKDWTIMVYMAGDNNLSEDMVTGLAEIKKCVDTIPDEIAVLAYYDSNVLDFPSIYIDFTEKFHIEPLRDGKGNIVEEGEVSKASLEQFVKWCVQKRERYATNYALIYLVYL